MKMKRRLLIAGIVAGSLLTLSPIVGLLGTVFGMTRAFQVLGSSGIRDPQMLSASIGETIVPAAVGFLLLPAGIILLTVSLILFLRLRASTPPPLPPQPRP